MVFLRGDRPRDKAAGCRTLSRRERSHQLDAGPRAIATLQEFFAYGRPLGHGLTMNVAARFLNVALSAAFPIVASSAVSR